MQLQVVGLECTGSALETLSRKSGKLFLNCSPLCADGSTCTSPLEALKKRRCWKFYATLRSGSEVTRGGTTGHYNGDDVIVESLSGS